MNKTEALARQQALVNQARAESRSLTPEEQAEFDRCQQIIDAAPADSISQGAPEGQRGADPAAPDPIQQALAAERQRTADITSLCRQVGMDADPFIRDGSDMNAVREAAVNFMIQHHGPVGGPLQRPRPAAGLPPGGLRRHPDAQRLWGEQPHRGGLSDASGCPCGIWPSSAWPGRGQAPPPNCCG